MTRNELYQQIVKKKSYLCIGLDSDLGRIPKHLLDFDDPIFEFNKRIIDATHDLCVAYKPNTAFYEARGIEGWKSLEKTLNYIPDSHFTIADAKRGDIGNTSRQYARAFFESLNFDSITVAPYMGSDSVMPFLEHSNKWVILLVLTSNAGSKDFQKKQLEEQKAVYEMVLEKAKEWGGPENLMFVVGATQPEYFEKIRAIVPDHFLLVPGVGAQGGSLEKVSEVGFNKYVGILVNSSRGIIYAGSGIDFAEKARAAASTIQQKMQILLKY